MLFSCAVPIFIAKTCITSTIPGGATYGGEVPYLSRSGQNSVLSISHVWWLRRCISPVSVLEGGHPLALQQYIPTVISARDGFIQLKFIHRAYYTPQRLAWIYPAHSEMCPKCQQAVGTYYHVIWDCPIIQDFWRKVLIEVNTVTSLSVSMDPKVLLLGVTD